MKNGAWNEHYFKTSSDQVVHTKTDGQASTVKEQLDGLNSALIREKITFQAYISGTEINYQNCYFIPAESKVHIEILLQNGVNSISDGGFICSADKKYMPSNTRDLMMIYRKKDESCHPGYCYASHDTTRPYLWLKHILDDNITDAIIIGEYTL